MVQCWQVSVGGKMAQELIRILVFIVVGFFLMFLIQPWLFENQILFIGDQNVQNWLSTQYQRAAYLVAVFSVLSTILWYVLSSRAKILSVQDNSQWRLLWWLIFLMPILSIGAALAFFNTSRDAQLWLAMLFSANVLILFWLPTATSSPAATKHLPPGSKLRKIFES